MVLFFKGLDDVMKGETIVRPASTIRAAVQAIV